MSVKMKVKYPKIKFDSEKRVYITFYLTIRDIGCLTVKKLTATYTLTPILFNKD